MAGLSHKSETINADMLAAPTCAANWLVLLNGAVCCFWWLLETHTHTYTRAGLWHRVRFSSGWVTDLISGPQTCWLIICMRDRRSFLPLDVHYMSSSRCVNMKLLLLMNANPARKRTKEGFTFNNAPVAAADLEWKRILCQYRNFIEILQQRRRSLHFYSDPPPPCLKTTNRKWPKWYF